MAHPGLYEFMTFNYSGRLKPDQTITAEIVRQEVSLTIRFEVLDKDRRGTITYPGFKFSNMEIRPTIHDYFCMIDPRIPPYSQYIEVDDRRY
jgi:hypothetical protein